MICDCGGKRFSAGQKCFHSVIVDELGNFDSDQGVEESDSPYGPYICIKCEKEYEEL